MNQMKLMLGSRMHVFCIVRTDLHVLRCMVLSNNDTQSESFSQFYLWSITITSGSETALCCKLKTHFFNLKVLVHCTEKVQKYIVQKKLLCASVLLSAFNNCFTYTEWFSFQQTNSSWITAVRLAMVVCTYKEVIFITDLYIFITDLCKDQFLYNVQKAITSLTSFFWSYVTVPL